MVKKPEEYRTITRDLTKSLEIFKSSREKHENMLTKFLDSVRSVFDALDSNAELSTDDLALAVQLVADADEKKRYILRCWRDLILDRMRSKSAPKLKKALIRALLEKYFSQFLNCLEDHELTDMLNERALMLSSISLINDATPDYLEFIRGPVASAIRDQMQKQGKKIGAG